MFLHGNDRWFRVRRKVLEKKRFYNIFIDGFYLPTK